MRRGGSAHRRRAVRRATTHTHNGLGRRSRGSRYEIDAGRRRWRRGLRSGVPGKRSKRIGPAARALLFTQLVRDSTRGSKWHDSPGTISWGPRAEEIPPNHQAEQRSSGGPGPGLSSRASGLCPLSCSLSPPFFRGPLCPVEAPMSPALGIPVLTTQALLPGRKSNSFHFQSLNP